MNAVLRIEPRWTDLDPVGHVNNSVFLVYAEEARNRLLRDVLPEAWESIVVVHNSIDYHRPVELSDEAVEVTAVVDAIGTSSFSTVNIITTVAGERCATVRTVQVVLRDDRSGTRPWGVTERAALESLQQSL
ncbi:thioesterase family protein [Mycobacterium avium subsp. hominissuis]